MQRSYIAQLYFMLGPLHDLRSGFLSSLVPYKLCVMKHEKSHRAHLTKDLHVFSLAAVLLLHTLTLRRFRNHIVSSDDNLTSLSKMKVIESLGMPTRKMDSHTIKNLLLRWR